MGQNNAVNVIGLDFEEIKQSIKNYLQTQTNIQDYNYDGSVMNTLLDVLAYNTHYQAFYANMVANEMFLDSALLRPSVVSHAKNLNYVPSSIAASKGIVDIGLSTPVSSDTYLPRGSEFSGINKAGARFKFVTLDTVFANSGATVMNSVTLYEGTIRRITYIYNRDTKIGSYLIIPNNKADMNTLKVRVYKSLTDNTGVSDVWTEGTTYLDLTPESKVYFLQEKDSGIYELYFGDGVIGQQPETGNVISIEYLETNGEAGNGVVSFSKQNDPNISYISFIPDTETGSTASETFGGANAEDTAKIKFTAPKFYQTSNRAVTKNDYSALEYKLYPNASSVNVYGGETVVPPQYGRVFIAIKPKSGGFLTTSEKISLENKLKTNYSIVTIDPKIIDPEYIDIILDTKVVYDADVLNITSGALKTLILVYMFSYSSLKLETFNSNFYYSNMVQGINNINPSILGVYTKIKMRKNLDISSIRANKGATFRFSNPLYHPYDGYVSVISSNNFPHADVVGTLYGDCILRDDGNGKLNVVRPDPDVDNSYLMVYPAVGTVDYDKGNVVLNSNFSPNTSSVGTAQFPIIITVEPDSTNLNALENSILRINNAYIDSVKVELSTEYDDRITTSIK